MRLTGRGIGRAIWLIAELGFIALRFFLLFVFTRGRPTLRQRIAWLHWGCHRASRVFMDRPGIGGPLPHSGLLVSNHLSYLDILLLGALTPAVFVSKADVKQWPVFGWFASWGGTVFVRREKRGEVGAVGDQIRQLLQAGHLVVLFPEGTSSGGDTVLPFKSSLLEPVSGQTYNVHAAGIAYFLGDGNASTDVCYWGDMVFGPHLAKLLGKAKIRARVNFADIPAPAPDRKRLAKQLHAAVLKLHAKARKA
jgi:1-acyl-sn-glycerol-3-phosphate acyltransferase